MGADRSPARYRSIATRLTYRRPVFTAILAQVNFWILTNALLVTISHLVIKAVAATYVEITPPPFLAVLALSAVTAIFYGTALGLIDVWVERHLGMGASLGRRILSKAVLYSMVFVVISIGTLAVFDMVMDDWFARMGMQLSDEARYRWALTFIPTTLVGNLVVSFIKQVNRSFGPGMLVSLLLGRYQKPITEQRIFMFMDLKSSTRHAEELGPERYSAMIRDLFHDIDTQVPQHEAEIYQYVGDEVVFTWNAPALRDKSQCVRFYFAIEAAIAMRAEHYQRAYDRIPTFKAGLHLGEVIAVEIGEIKREIAYHGDTINTAARIQSMCSDMGRPLIISESMLRTCWPETEHPLRTEALGAVILKGKQNHVNIYAVVGGSVGASEMAPMRRASSSITEV
ncbi:MAG: adenylate/guanylate cyclase domain-containing protein [Flavobacteriales bacterium]|nr:adenylate/guanylate cyclase domain-containing protein [Flavobacteriales bacterium]